MNAGRRSGTDWPGLSGGCAEISCIDRAFSNGYSFEDIRGFVPPEAIRLLTP